MLKIVRNDLIKMQCEAIVNTANSEPVFASGVDSAVYEAAGAEELLEARRKIGRVEEGEVFATESYRLPFKKIIHAVSPLYIDGVSGEEEKLRACYRKSLELAVDLGIKSIAFPIIATGSFGYPIEQGMSIAVEEINSFLTGCDMLVYLVVFDDKATNEGKKYKPDLESYIENHYVQERISKEYPYFSAVPERGVRNPFARMLGGGAVKECAQPIDFADEEPEGNCTQPLDFSDEALAENCEQPVVLAAEATLEKGAPHFEFDPNDDDSFYELEDKLNERLKHIKDSYSDYLMYLIESRGMTPLEVYSNSVVSKKLFSKIKTNPDYHPSKEVALRLCVGARLNIDDSKDLLSRAGYTFSPCELYDLIFEFFIENEIYDIVEIAVQLEEHGLESFIDV